ncbi:hypothetical protein BD309DRAFT_38512 [Dichomitus squalens]|nr:hypothetical protein BD309DRAFT_38512 [Dichomitus squalens]
MFVAYGRSSIRTGADAMPRSFLPTCLLCQSPVTLHKLGCRLMTICSHLSRCPTSTGGLHSSNLLLSMCFTCLSCSCLSMACAVSLNVNWCILRGAMTYRICGLG